MREPRDFNAVINIRRYAVRRMRPEELLQTNFAEQPMKLEAYKEKLKPVAHGPSTKMSGGFYGSVSVYPAWSCHMYRFIQHFWTS